MLEQKILNHNKSSSQQRFNLTFILMALALVACLGLAYMASQRITIKEDMKRFDPYEILDITRGATLKEIR